MYDELKELRKNMLEVYNKLNNNLKLSICKGLFGTFLCWKALSWNYHKYLSLKDRCYVHLRLCLELLLCSNSKDSVVIFSIHISSLELCLLIQDILFSAANYKIHYIPDHNFLIFLYPYSFPRWYCSVCEI